MSSRTAMNAPIIAEFRANGGKVGGQFADTPLLLLTTTGRKSGRPRTSPLAYTADGDRLIVIAANGGRPTDPGWYVNLLANPEATVELGTERDRLYAQQAARIPAFAFFPARTDHLIPVVVLERIG